MPLITVQSEIAGNVWKIEFKVGDTVTEDDEIVILESMKMEIPIYPPTAGIVRQILVQEGDAVQEGQGVVVIETA